MPMAMITCEKCGTVTEIGAYLEVKDDKGKVVGRWAFHGHDETHPGIVIKSVLGLCGKCGGMVSWSPMDQMMARIKNYVNNSQ